MAGACAFAALAVVALPRSAAASPLFELAGAAQGNGGFNGRTIESGSASTYFNPALLTDAESGIDLGVFVLSDQISVHAFSRPDGADIPVGAVDAQRPGGGRYGSYGLPTDWLQNGKPADPPDSPLNARPRQHAGSGQNVRAYQLLGLVQRLFQGRLVLGLYAMIPYNEFTGAAAFYSDEREQYFTNSLHPELYSDRLTATSFAFGTGIKVTETLSLGVAATLSLRTVAQTPTYVNDVGHFDDIKVDSNVKVNVDLAPHFGVKWQALPNLHFTGTVHTPQKFVIGTDFTFLLANGLEQGASIRFTHAYLPWTFGLGAAVDVLKTASQEVTFAGTLVHARWSGYVDRHDETPDPSYGWYDTFSGTVGARYRRGATRTFLDVTYVPSPVPDQTGRTSYVDNDRVGTSAGVDYRFPLWGGTIRAGVQGQLQRLLARETYKISDPTHPAGVIDEVPDDAVVNSQPLKGREGLQTNNPGWPGFGSSGWILGGGVNLSFTQ
jgi:long-chain fatty acid transport protein